MAVENNLQKLQKLLDFVEQYSFTRKDFEDAFKQVLEILLKNQESLRQTLADLQARFNHLVESTKSDNKNSLQNLEKQVDKLFVEGKLEDMTKEQRKMFESLKSEVRAKVPVLSGKVNVLLSVMPLCWNEAYLELAPFCILNTSTAAGKKSMLPDLAEKEGHPLT